MATSQDGETRLRLILGLLSACLLVACSFFAFYLPLTPARMILPTAQLIDALPVWSFARSVFWTPQSSQTVALLMGLFGVTAFGVYGIAIAAVWNRPSQSKTRVLLISTSLAFFLASASSLPNFDSDIYNHISSGRVAAAHGRNPHYVAADQFPDDPIYPYASRRYTNVPGDNKLPAWTILNVGLASLAGDGVVANLLVYRFAFLLANVANVLLVASLLGCYAPRHQLSGIVFYGWNPITVLQGQTKVDTLMVFFLLLAAWLLIRCSPRQAIVSLALSALVKLITLPLIAVYWLQQVRLRRWRFLAVDTLLITVTALVVYLPFLNDTGLLRTHLGLLAKGGSSVPDVSRALVGGGFLLLVCAVGWTRDGSPQKLLWGWAVVMLYFSAFLAKIGFAWYLLPLIALVSLVPDSRLALLTISLTFASFAFNVRDLAFNQSFSLPDILGTSRWLAYLGLAVAAPACTMMLLELIRFARHRAAPIGHH